MNNKIIKTFQAGSFITLILLTVNLMSQTRIWSPYSRYGLGELNFETTSFFSSMGGTAIAFSHPNYINNANPASYGSVKEKSFLFDAGAIFAPRYLETNDVQEMTFFSSLNNLQFAFPLMKKWGGSLGMFPFSSIGYKIKHEETLDSIGKVNYTYEGWGGLNTVYLGTGAEIAKGLSVGVNFNYIFGNIDRRRIAIFDTTGFTNTRITNRVNISDVSLNFGIQYRKKFYRKYVADDVVKKEFTGFVLSFGLAGGNTTSLHAKENLLAVHFSGGNPFAPAKDTVFWYENQINDITLPLYIGGGISVEKENRWLAGIDIRWQKWSDFMFAGLSDTLHNTLRLSVGGALIPKERPISNMLGRSTVLWGTHFYNNYLELKNTRLTQYGISFGLAMPVRRTGTALQISFEIGRSGTLENNLIRETYGKLKIGVSITDKWFYRSKYE